MRVRKKLTKIAARPLQFAGRWPELPALTQKWARGLDAYHQQAMELGRNFLSGTQGGSPETPVVDVGATKSWQRRVVSMLVSFCAAALLVGGVGGFFLFLLNFCLLLLLVSKGLGLRVQLPDVFQTP